MSNERFLRRLALRFSCFLQVVVAIAATLLSTWGELPVNLEAVDGCQAYTCILLYYRNLPVLYFKNFVETVNLVLAVYFLRLLRAKEISNANTWVQRKRWHLRNRLVRSILLLCS